MKMLEKRKKKRSPKDNGDLLKQALETNREAHRKFFEYLQSVAEESGVEVELPSFMKKYDDKGSTSEK